jgi:hypothetical protein
MRKLSGSLILSTLVIGAVIVGGAQFAQAGRGNGPLSVIYVTSQDLFYDTFATKDPLPPHGDFQLLEMGGPADGQTEFGPGDPGYLGGRWWVDVNGNGERDEGDHYFLCPLLGPGRDSP